MLPPLAVGCSYGHGTLLAGTLSLTPEQLADAVRQVVEWAAISGLRKVLVVNGHLGNQSALGVGTDHLRLCRTDLRVGVTSWWSAAEAVAAEVFTDGEDVHANRAETSLMLAVAPHLVSLEMLAESDDPDRTATSCSVTPLESFRPTALRAARPRPTPTSVYRLFEVAVEAVVDMVRRGRAEVPPLVPAGRTNSRTRRGRHAPSIGGH